MRLNPAGEPTVDFARADAVRELNRALLRAYYRIRDWDLPDGYLCPPVPGRADYVHHVADLIAEGDPNAFGRGPSVRVLDIGVGANCIYPIIGVAEYGWRFVGTELDPRALESARRIVAANPGLAPRVELRLQRSAVAVLEGVVRPGETFAASVCNPPFHASAAEAAEGSRRKVNNLSGRRSANPELNFGGRSHELWCPGGEVAFVRRLIADSARQPALCRWFTTLVSRRESLPAIERALGAVRPAEARTIAMAQGQKQSRMVAWRF